MVKITVLVILLEFLWVLVRKGESIGGSYRMSLYDYILREGCLAAPIQDRCSVSLGIVILFIQNANHR